MDPEIHKRNGHKFLMVTAGIATLLISHVSLMLEREKSLALNGQSGQQTPEELYLE